jgi:Zn-dependent peptidase ImmA (M78 family)
MKFKVFGKNVPVKFTDLSEEDAYGIYSRKTGKILIDSKLKDDKLLHTLLHEGFHAVFDRVSIRQGVGTEAEEIICDTFATFLLENFVILPKDEM